MLSESRSHGFVAALAQVSARELRAVVGPSWTCTGPQPHRSSPTSYTCFWQCRELLFITGVQARKILQKVLRKNTLWVGLTVMQWICMAKRREEVGQK